MDNFDYPAIGQRIKQLRKRKGLNQPGVEESKVAAYAVMGYESEEHNRKREEMKNRPEEKKAYIFE